MKQGATFLSNSSVSSPLISAVSLCVTLTATSSRSLSVASLQPCVSAPQTEYL